MHDAIYCSNTRYRLPDTDFCMVLQYGSKFSVEIESDVVAVGAAGLTGLEFS